MNSSSSNARPAVVAPVTDATLIRAVETQYVASTMRLVDSPQAQDVLERALEASKPPIPKDCERLDYLLYTPFRYPPSPWPSRFRSPTDPGVFYGAEHVRTALAEVAHWRLQVLLDAVEMRVLEPTAHTLFSVRIRATTASVTDIASTDKQRAILDPDDYGPAQQWGRGIRDADIEAIRYPSVRDQPDGVCWAVLTPRVFRSRPRLLENWMIRVTRESAQCRRVGDPHTSVVFESERLLARSLPSTNR